jgi:hypothetical protein
VPKKKIPNTLYLVHARSDEIMSFITQCKKNHFDCSESKLYDSLNMAFYDSNGYYVVYLSTYPYIAVHITGRNDKLMGNEHAFQEKIETVLKNHLKPI